MRLWTGRALRPMRAPARRRPPCPRRGPAPGCGGVGNDYDHAIARTVGPNQTKVDEYLASSGDTFWVQRETAVTPTPGPVTINGTAPTTDRWNLAAIEIPAAVQDTTAP